MGSTGREEELQQGVVGKRPASPAPHPKLHGRRGGSSAQFGLQPESAGLLTSDGGRAVVLGALGAVLSQKTGCFPTVCSSIASSGTLSLLDIACSLLSQGGNGMLYEAGW